MNTQNQLNPTESLNVISNAINKTKENIKDQCFYYILWGWLVSIASFSHYLLIVLTEFKHSYLPWLILMPLGWLVSFIYSKRKERKIKYETYLDVFFKNLWIAIGISFISTIFISTILKVNPTSFILLLAGIGTLVSGLTMKFKPLSIGGILLFVFSIFSLFVGETETLLLNSIAIIFGYLVPAYLLRKSK